MKQGTAPGTRFSVQGSLIHRSKVAGVACLIGLTMTLSAAKAGSVHVNSVWFVEPSPAPGEALSLKPHELLVTTRLLPPALAVLDEPIADPEYDRPVEKGTQLFGVLDGSIWNPKAPPFPIFCEVNGFPSKANARPGSTPIIRRCMVDTDRDGRLDGMFSIPICMADFPAISNWDLPKKLVPISAHYSNVPITALNNGPRVGILFDGFTYLNGKARFFRAFGSGEVIPSLGRQSQRKSNGEEQLFGASFVIQESMPGSVKVKIIKPIPPQIFAMVNGDRRCF